MVDVGEDSLRSYSTLKYDWCYLMLFDAIWCYIESIVYIVSVVCFNAHHTAHRVASHGFYRGDVRSGGTVPATRCYKWICWHSSMGDIPTQVENYMMRTWWEPFLSPKKKLQVNLDGLIEDPLGIVLDETQKSTDWINKYTAVIQHHYGKRRFSEGNCIVYKWAMFYGYTELSQSKHLHFAST